MGRPPSGAVADHAPNPTFSLCNMNHLRALAPDSPNCVCYSRIRGSPPPDLLYEFHAGQHASHYGVLEFRSPLTACDITAAVDGVNGINQGFESLAAVRNGVRPVRPGRPRRNAIPVQPKCLYPLPRTPTPMTSGSPAALILQKQPAPSLETVALGCIIFPTLGDSVLEGERST